MWIRRVLGVEVADRKREEVEKDVLQVCLISEDMLVVTG